MTEQELYDELQSYKEFTIRIDASKLIDATVKHWNFFKYFIELNHNKNLIVPEVSFNTDDIKEFLITLNWTKGPHYLDVEIFDGRDSVYVYYLNESNQENSSYWCKLENCLDEEFVNHLLLFTEERK